MKLATILTLVLLSLAAVTGGCNGQHADMDGSRQAVEPHGPARERHGSDLERWANRDTRRSIY